MQPIGKPVCKNFPDCQNQVTYWGDLCESCKKYKEQLRRNKWRWHGWTRQEESEKLKHHHGKKDG